MKSVNLRTWSKWTHVKLGQKIREKYSWKVTSGVKIPVRNRVDSMRSSLSGELYSAYNREGPYGKSN